ncbi:hypothetical protein DRN94_001715 [archaeon]|mgnify:CR=1 FL=1|nr:hypothetical protein [archaeon]
MPLRPPPYTKPLRVLQRYLNTEVIVRLKSGTEYRGVMVHMDSFMNMVLKNAIEVQRGEPVINYGTLILRGNNVLYIQLPAYVPTEE